MPDDMSAHMQARGALPVTIRARLTDSERLVRHAAWRLPMEHQDSALIDRVHAKGWLTPTQYANGCACAALWAASGQGRSRGVASWLRETGDGPGGVQRGPEDDWRDLLRDCQARDPVGLEMLLKILAGDETANGSFCAGRAGQLLDTLDAVAAKWDGERYRDE